MWRTGLSNDMPNIPSMTTWCDSPIPSASRPPVIACVVSACWASITG